MKEKKALLHEAGLQLAEGICVHCASCKPTIGPDLTSIEPLLEWGTC